MKFIMDILIKVKEKDMDLCRKTRISRIFKLFILKKEFKSIIHILINNRIFNFHNLKENKKILIFSNNYKYTFSRVCKKKIS